MLDTNLLVLLVVGSAGRGLIGRFRRTANYTEEDFDLVLEFIRRCSRVVLTPQVLAELTNLLPLANNDPRARCVLASMIEVLVKAGEEYVNMNLMLGEPEVLCRIGFTDLSLLEAARKKDYLVLTDDFPCAGQLEAAGCRVVNLNRLRETKWSP